MRVVLTAGLLWLAFLTFAGQCLDGAERSKDARAKRSSANTAGWLDFTMPTANQPEGDAADLSNLLDPPAGKYGFLSARDGHFYFANGRRQKFWGVNLRWSELPNKEDAPAVARRLGRFGINLVGVIWGSGGTPEVDRLDFFVAELKKNGIYACIALEGPQSGPAVYFVEQVSEIHRKFANDLLLHKNPYTDLRYVDEPALAVLQMAGDNSIFDYPEGTSPEHQRQLESQWNAWLLRRYRNRAGLAQAWTTGQAGLPADAEKQGRALLPEEDPEKGTVTLAPRVGRLGDATRFLAEVARGYYEKFYRHLQKIGLKCPITTTNAASHIAPVSMHAVGDAVAVNASVFEQVAETPSTRATRGIISQVAAASVAGKPLVAIVPQPGAPGNHECERPILIAAYAALQDWDGVIWENGVCPYFPIAARMFLEGLVSPGRLSAEMISSDHDLYGPQRVQWSEPDGIAGHSPASWLPFLSRMRNRFAGELPLEPEKSPDGEKHEKTVILYSGPVVERLITSWGTKAISLSKSPPPDPSQLLGPGEEPDGHWMYYQYIILTRPQLAIHWNRKMANSPFFVSDTGQLRWDYGAGRFEFDTSRCQGIVGQFGGQTRDLSTMRLNVTTPFCAVSAISLDGLNLEDSKRILVCAAARSVGAWHFVPSQSARHLPTLIEPVKAEINLRHNPFKSLLGLRWRVWALDPSGRRVREVPTKNILNFTQFKIGDKAASLWYEVVVEENAVLPFKH